MIEAVNSVLANAQLLRGNAEQAGSARSAALDSANAEPPSVPVAPYISPYISVDANYNQAVIQIRDSDTGAVVNQFPSESRLQARAREQAIREQVSQETSSNVPVPSVESAEIADVNVSSGGIPQAQIASAALRTGAESGVQAQSAGVSVFA